MDNLFATIQVSIYSKTNLELKNNDTWMVANKLSKNINKTVHLLLGPSSRKIVKQSKTIILTLQNKPVIQVR